MRTIPMLPAVEQQISRLNGRSPGSGGDGKEASESINDLHGTD